MKIKKIERKHFEGKVYNIGTPENHNYFASNILVHNCYMGSTKDGVHANTSIIYNFLEALSKLKVFEACLVGDTPIFTPQGVKRISELSVGDIVYDSNYRPSTVTNIKKRQSEPVICLKGNKGWKIICTPNHPFMVNGEQIRADEMAGKKIDLAPIIDVENVSLSINLLPYVTKRAPALAGGRGGNQGGFVDGGKCKLQSSSDWVNHTIELNDDLMWLYGLIVAEGDKKGISLSSKENEFAARANEVYGRITGGLETRVRNNGGNAIRVEFKNPSVYETIFFKEMRVGYGAHEKSINYLFGLPNRLIRAALIGMFDGDGCYRIKRNKQYTDYSLSYKTASWKLANELVYLLRTRFGVFASLYEGVNVERFIEGRELPKTTYYKIDVYGKKNIDRLMPKLFAHEDEYVGIGGGIYSANKNHDYIKIGEIEDAGVADVYDITLDSDSTHVFQLQHGALTHNCFGGGEPTMHPNFVNILKRTRELGIVPNFTTRNLAWLKQPEIAKEIIENMGAFAYSVSNIKDIQKLNALVDYVELEHSRVNLHVVMGTVSEYAFTRILQEAQKYDFRVTLLGYKESGFGKNYKDENKFVKYDWWLKVILGLKETGELPTISIDTVLAKEYHKDLIELGVPPYMYYTEDGKFSAYFDAVNLRFGAASYLDKEEMVQLDKQVVGYKGKLEDKYYSADDFEEIILKHYKDF